MLSCLSGSSFLFKKLYVAVSSPKYSWSLCSSFFSAQSLIFHLLIKKCFAFGTEQWLDGAGVWPPQAQDVHIYMQIFVHAQLVGWDINHDWLNRDSQSTSAAMWGHIFPVPILVLEMIGKLCLKLKLANTLQGCNVPFCQYFSWMWHPFPFPGRFLPFLVIWPMA